MHEPGLFTPRTLCAGSRGDDRDVAASRSCITRIQRENSSLCRSFILTRYAQHKRNGVNVKAWVTEDNATSVARADSTESNDGTSVYALSLRTAARAPQVQGRITCTLVQTSFPGNLAGGKISDLKPGLAARVLYVVLHERCRDQNQYVPNMNYYTVR